MQLSFVQDKAYLISIRFSYPYIMYRMLNGRNVFFLSMAISSLEAFILNQAYGGPQTSRVQNRFSFPQLQAHGSNMTFTAVIEHDKIDKLSFLKTMDKQLTELQQVSKVDTISSSVYNLQTPVQEKKEGETNKILKARLLLLCAAALYGTNFSLVKIMGDTMPVEVSSTLRFGLAALFTFPWLVEDLSQDSALLATLLGFEVGLWNFVGYITQAVGLETTSASKSAFICSLAVVVVPILDFTAGKCLCSRQWIGSLLAMIGVAFLELGGDLSMQSITSGDILSLLQPIAFGIGFWKMESAMRKCPDQAGRMTAAQLLAVFVASSAYGSQTLDPAVLQSLPWKDWLATPSLLMSIFWTGVVTTALTIYMENLALETLSAAETTLIFSTEPIWGTVFATFVMGEQLGFNAMIGAMFILIACFYSNIDIEGISSVFNTSEKKNL